MTYPICLSLGDIILIIHFAWAAWMVSGVIVAILGFWRPRFWKWKIFRTTHMIGLIGTATVPFWAEGICPLTIWEYRFSSENAAAENVESFLVQWLRETLYLDVDPLILSLISGAGALFTPIMFILRSPWRK
jgi:hypothetical protein